MMQRITTRWFRHWLEQAHECEGCGDIDKSRAFMLRCVAGRSSANSCAERAGEFEIPAEQGRWRHSDIR